MSDEKKELVASVGDAAAPDARKADVADDAGPLAKSDSNIKPVTVTATVRPALLDSDEKVTDDPSPSPDTVSIVSSVEARETYPEGGAQAWLVVLGSWLAMFASLGLLNVLATFQTYIVSHQLSNYDAGTIGWIFSLYTFLSFFLGIYVGPLFDRYGPRWLILAGTVCTVTGLMLLSVSFEYWHFLLAFGLLSGTGTALLFTPSIAVIGHYFNEKRGLATGVASTAGSVGGILFPLMLDGLFVRVGWAWAIRILGFLCLAVTFVANFLIRSRLPPSPDARPHPDPRIFRSLAFSLTTAAVFMLEFALFIPLTYISGYALSKGFSERFAFDILAILNTGSFCGRLLVGYWADSVGAFNANIICVLATVIACFGLWLPAGDTTPGLIIFAIIFGFCSGSNISLVPVAISRLCKTQEYGRYYATTYTIVSTACLIGIPIGGKIITDNDGDYWGLIVTTGMFYVGSLAAFLAAKVSLVGWNVWAIL